MNIGKKLIFVVIDSDKAMRKAIKNVLPDVTHHICAWHLKRDAQSNIGDVNFTKKFKICLLGDFDVREFEVYWNDLVNEFGVAEHN